MLPLRTSSGPAKRKSDDVELGRDTDDAAVTAARRQTLASLYQVEHPYFF
jgi:hypothetical protein